MTKKTALNILILVVVVAVMVVVYFLFFQADDQTPNQPQNNGSLPVVSNFFPEAEQRNQQNTNNQNNDRPTNINQNIPKLRQISKNPTAGFTLTDKISTTTQLTIVSGGEASSSEEIVESITKEEEVVVKETFYTFINRSNGNVYESTSKILGAERLTNTTIPKVYGAYFSDNRNFVYQQLEGGLVRSFFVSLYEPETETNNDATSTKEVLSSSEFLSLETTELPFNIKNVLTSDNGLVFYTTPDPTGVLSGSVFDIKSPEIETSVFESEMNYLNFSWLSDTSLLFGTKPTVDGENILFRHNTNTDADSKVLDLGVAATFIPNKKTGNILISDGGSLGIQSFMYNTLSGDQYEIDLKTFVGEKCVWSNKDEGVIYCAEPNPLISPASLINWYKGEISFNDVLYKVDAVSGTKSVVDGFDGDFDVIKPQLSEGDDFFVFINKKDLTLWSLDLNN